MEPLGRDELSCMVDSYKLTVRKSAGKLHLRAYSELTGKLLEEYLNDDGLST